MSEITHGLCLGHDKNHVPIITTIQAKNLKSEVKKLVSSPPMSTELKITNLQQ